MTSKPKAPPQVVAATHRCNLLAPEFEYLDPNPDLHSLFLEYNKMFFQGRLAGCEVKWSKRMTLCAGLCSYQPRSGFCSIRLSEPLLKLRPRSDTVNTLLHEMIHAFVFVATPVRDHDDHGPIFQAHMRRINEAAMTQITVYHTFHDEVDSYRQHIWQCNGPCRRTPPYFGLVKRAMNRAPGPTDYWWTEHDNKCGGTYTKIKEPAEYTAKQEKKKERQLAREEKQRKKENEAKSTHSVQEFFPTVGAKTENTKPKKTGDVKPPGKVKKPLPQPETGKVNNKRRKKEHEDNGIGSTWPMLSFPNTGPVIFAAGDDGDFFLAGDVQVLFQVPATFSHAGTREPQNGGNSNAAGTGNASFLVDLTVSDSDEGDEDLFERKRATPSTTVLPQPAPGNTDSAEPDVIEID